MGRHVPPMHYGSYAPEDVTSTVFIAIGSFDTGSIASYAKMSCHNDLSLNN